jgi:hypothetical protein
VFIGSLKNTVQASSLIQDVNFLEAKR